MHICFLKSNVFEYCYDTLTFYVQLEIGLYIMSPILQSFNRFNLWIQYKKKKGKTKEKVTEVLIQLSQ